MKRITSFALGIILLLSMSVPAFAAEQPAEIEAAGLYLHEQGIYLGDSSGNLMLDKGLTRAEMAAILTRLHSGEEVNPEQYIQACHFTDVPAWAKSYVGYCVANLLVSGYDASHFGPNDMVTPAMACTVVLRCYGYGDSESSAWTYGTAGQYAASLGLISPSTAQASIITRGEMAVLIYRAQTGTRPGTAPSTGTGDGFLSNGKPVTEENVLEILRQLKQDWPHGTVWGTHNTSGTHKNEVPSTAANRIMDVYWVSEYYGCSGYASMVSSLIFGDKTNPGRKLDDLTKMRPGDIVFVVSPDGVVGHVVIALESPNQDGRFHYTDGNHGEIITWPSTEHPDIRSYSLTGFSGGRIPHHLEVWTRYPENVPFTGESVEVWPAVSGS